MIESYFLKKSGWEHIATTLVAVQQSIEFLKHRRIGTEKIKHKNKYYWK